MHLYLVTDAWAPQVNGVVRTLGRMVEEAEAKGHTVTVIHPGLFRTWPCPTYPEIRLALFAGPAVRRMLEDAQPDAVHIATEAPLGWAARKHCLKRDWPFTTSFHTKFPEYVKARTGIPTGLGYALLRHFHNKAAAVMVNTPTMQRDLTKRGVRNLVIWTRGVDTALFRPGDKSAFDHLTRPVFLYVGRVAVEKNVRAFLELDLPGSKAVVGDGPMLGTLRQRYPEVAFVGAKHGSDLADHYAGADVFVFPSLTDTYGLVMLEALASGLPVAAYPVPGPNDVINGHDIGVLDDDLGRAARAAVEIPSERCRNFALDFSWTRSADQFLDNLAAIR
jgi:glycosyltransferase involved in cell wall biosynthesis